MARAPGDLSTSPTPSRSPTESSLTVNGRSAAFRLPTSISSASTGDSGPVSTHRRAPIQRSRRTTSGCSRDRPYRRRSPSKRALVSRVRRTPQHATRCVNVGRTLRYDESHRMVRRGRNLDRDPKMRFNDLSEPHTTRTVVTSNQRATCCQPLSSSLGTPTILLRERLYSIQAQPLPHQWTEVIRQLQQESQASNSQGKPNTRGANRTSAD